MTQSCDKNPYTHRTITKATWEHKNATKNFDYTTVRLRVEFMSNLQKSKLFDHIDKFNDASQYFDDISTIDNPAFAEYIPDIHPRELQLNKANTSDKETSFLDLNIKVIGNNIHTSVHNKREMTLDFL